MIKGLLLDVKKNTIEEFEIEKGYVALQKVLGVDTFNVVTRRFGDVWLDIYVDDEGLFKENNPLAVITYEGNGRVVEEIVGTVFVAKCNKNGETISLTNKDFKNLRESVFTYWDYKNNLFRNVLVCKV